MIVFMCHLGFNPLPNNQSSSNFLLHLGIHTDFQMQRTFSLTKTISLPTRSEEREVVLGAGSIPVAILLSCQNVRNDALLLHKHALS